MKPSETTLLALKDGRAVVSTDDLYRIVKMPEGRIVGELADIWEAIHQITKDGSGRHGAWRIAISYDLCRIIERAGVSLNDLAIQPIGQDCCRWCGAHDTEIDCVYECGTFVEEQDDGTECVERTDECEENERARREIMVKKSAALYKLLVDAGVDVDNDEGNVWLFDARPSGAQFVSHDVGPLQGSAATENP